MSPHLFEPATVHFNNRPNPYVGPRAFRLNEKLFGRTRETGALFDLLLAERVVLLHAQSGAGKSSLIQAALIPMLIEEGFNVFPVARVSHPPADDDPSAPNRYVRSTIMDLEAGYQQTDADLTRLSLIEYFERYDKRARENPDLLIVDQFEEMFTLDPADAPAKEEFFRQLGIVLHNRNRWALISMRDDFIGGLVSYHHLLPTRLAHRFRLELLSRRAATEAIRGPAIGAGVQYSDAAVDQLVDDLRTVRRQLGSGDVVNVQGPYIEPVHLQVVCTNLWRRLSSDADRIGAQDIDNVGDVDSALGEYYAHAIGESSRAAQCDEGSLRMFVGKELINNGVRAQSLMGVEVESGVPAAALDELENRYIVRRDERRGAMWYELAHDRLIGPIENDNRQWKAKNDSTLTKSAEEWDRNGRPSRLLLFANMNRIVRAYRELRVISMVHIAQSESALPIMRPTTPVVDEYLKASRQRLQLRAFQGLLALTLIVSGAAYSAFKRQENSELKQALVVTQAQFDSLRQARDTIDALLRALGKDWGLRDTTSVAVRNSLNASVHLQEAIAARPEEARAPVQIHVTALPTDSRSFEDALRVLGFEVRIVGSSNESTAIPPNVISFGDSVPLADVRVVALAFARSGVALRRVCPMTNSLNRERVVQISGWSSAQQLKPLSVDVLNGIGAPREEKRSKPADGTDAFRRLQCDRSVVETAGR